MTAQWILVLVAAVVALGYLLRGLLQTRSKESGCGGGCNCSRSATRPTLISTKELAVRLRSRRDSS
jgi:hypothetical protein